MDAALAPATRAPDEHHGDALRDALVQAIGREYEVVRLIGRGGMGAVYLARDRALERLVAIKVLPPGSATEADLVERFRREARTVANLQHGSIVPLYAFGEERGLCWFVMGYVRGESLAARLQREGALEPDTARALLAQVADALDHAHRQGVIHRDIKPDNILIDDTTGRALLTDFGIARADSMLAATSLTQVGSVMGTPHYMSPEQAAAEPTVDGRADLYSVGVVGYEMLSGRLPFNGKSFRELLVQHVSAEPPALSTVAPAVPADLAGAVMRCLQKDPAQRFPDGASLRAAVGGQTVDEESLAYELTDLRHSVAYVFIACLLAGLTTGIAKIGDGTLFGLPWWFHALSPIFLWQYIPHMREARQRGFAWADIWRVMTLPPRWWMLWWPRRWRRSTDVWDKLPSLLKASRYAVTAASVLVLLEFPVIALLNEQIKVPVADLVPEVHALYAIRSLAKLQTLPGLFGLMGYLVLLISAFLLALWLARRAGRPFGLSKLDCQRAAVKPTDSPFWRDPRIRPLLLDATAATDRRPSTPQEFVTQILATARTTAPGTARDDADAAAAARLLLEAILACDKEQAMLEKNAPREQLDRLEAELVLLESDNGDAEAVSLLTAQRESLVRSRERIGRLSERRADATARLEQLWSDTQRLGTLGGDAEASRALRVQLRERATQAARDFPSRTRSTTGRSTAAAALLLCLGMSVAAAQSPVATAKALYDRGQPDSGLAVLAAATDSSARRWSLEGQLHLQRAARANPFTRLGTARRARIAFERAAERDTAAIDAREQLVWLYRLLPWFAGGSAEKSAAVIDTLDARAPYRAELLRGYMARYDRDPRTAAERFRNLTVAAPDSAGAWFALADLAALEGRIDEARTALARYRTLRPDDRAALYHLGKLSAKHGVDLIDGEAALRLYVAEKARPEQPYVDMAWWWLGQIFEKQGRIADARRAYKEAIKLDPKYADYQKSLKALPAETAAKE